MFHRSRNLLLRPAFPEDSPAIYRAIADEGIARNLASAPWPYTQEDARRFVQSRAGCRLPGFVLVLPERPEAGIVGSAGLSLNEAGAIQLGYWMARPFWGRGLATEAGAAVISIARAIGIEALVASHFTDNPASGRVLEKLGFCGTGVIRPHACLARGGPAPAVEYELDLARQRMEPRRAA